MEKLFKNQFIQTLGVIALVYLILQAIGWGTEAILNILESFSRWYKYYGLKWSEEAALAFGVLFLLLSAVASSKHRN